MLTTANGIQTGTSHPTYVTPNNKGYNENINQTSINPTI